MKGIAVFTVKMDGFGGDIPSGDQRFPHSSLGGCVMIPPPPRVIAPKGHFLSMTTSSFRARATEGSVASLFFYSL